MSIPSTTRRVQMHTAQEINERIHAQTVRNILYYAENPEKIEERLAELDREWDIERTLETQASALTLGSMVLGTLVNRRFLFMPALIGGFLMQHAVKGWCPPLPVFRRMGVRTQAEIEKERYALKALRGDFDEISHAASEASQVQPREMTRRIMLAVDNT